MVRVRKVKQLMAAALVAVAGSAWAEVKVTDLTKQAKVTAFEVKGNRVDRFTVKTLPEELKGLPLVYVPRGSHQNPGTGYSFKVDAPVMVYLLVDARRAGQLKFEGWEKSELKASWLAGGTEYQDVIFVKEFPAGKVEIPANPKDCIPHSAVIKEK